MKKIPMENYWKDYKQYVNNEFEKKTWLKVVRYTKYKMVLIDRITLLFYKWNEEI